MNLIQPSVIEITQEVGIAGMIGQIDYCAGICYGREFQHVSIDKQKSFVQGLIDKNHMRPLEFGTVYLKITSTDAVPIQAFKRPWCNVVTVTNNNKLEYYITTNYRYIIEEGLTSALEYWHEPCDHHIKRRTFKFVCTRAVADEYRTHISLSSLMKSTRYCKLIPLDVIKPVWFDSQPEALQEVYTGQLEATERTYRALLSAGLAAQHARGVLPMDMATTLLLCGTVDVPNWGWDRFIKMRVSEAAAPEARILAEQIQKVLYDAK